MRHLFVVLLCIFMLYGCGINKVAYGIQHGNEPAADPAYLPGMTLINMSTGDKLDRVVDFDYDEKTDTIKYVRIDPPTGKGISGVIKYADAKITNGHGELVYNKKKREWVYISNGKEFDIYQHIYNELEVIDHDGR